MEAEVTRFNSFFIAGGVGQLYLYIAIREKYACLRGIQFSMTWKHLCTILFLNILRCL